MPDFGRAAGNGAAHPLAYDGERSALFRIVLRNTLLSLVTLGFYRFWGKTHLRRYLWGRLRLFGDQLEYTGTAKELLIGFLIALGILIPLGVTSGVVGYLTAASAYTLQIAINIAYYLILGFLIGVAIFRARRYQLTRTHWRGIRFGQSGSSVRYALMWTGYSLLTLVTLGIARPVGEVALQRYVLENTWFGSVHFEFNGKAGHLMGRWILCLLLVPFTLGLSLLWYAALRIRYFALRTRFTALSFEMPITFGNLASIYLPYYLIVLLVFGLLGFLIVPAMMMGGTGAIPVGPILAFAVIIVILPALQSIMVTHPLIALVADRLAVTGDINLDTIVQRAQTGPRTGEGLADALDVGGGIEVGL